MHHTTSKLIFAVLIALLASGCILGPQPEPPEIGDQEFDWGTNDRFDGTGVGVGDCDDNVDGFAGACDPAAGEDDSGMCDRDGDGTGRDEPAPPGDMGYDDQAVPSHERVRSPFDIEDLQETAGGITSDSYFESEPDEGADGDDEDDDDLWVVAG